MRSWNWKAICFCIIVPICNKPVIAQSYTGRVLYSMDPNPLPNGIVGITFNNRLELTQVAAGGQVAWMGYTGSYVNNYPNDHALLWQEADAKVVDLNPAGYVGSDAVATDGLQQVGDGTPAGSSSTHAMLWNGSADQFVDLNPSSLSGITGSVAFGIGSGQQVGVGDTAQGNVHAMVWTGTAASAVDLNPIGFTISRANATDGTQQVGFATAGAAGHAILWSGSAESAVDLNPTGLGAYGSEADGVGGGEQVGYAGFSYGEDAVLWRGSSSSAIDLYPYELDITDSFAIGTNGNVQVGYGYHSSDIAENYPDALLWEGTPESAVDLQTLLPANRSWFSSIAYSADAAGNVYGIAEGEGTYNGDFAVEWSPVPEPAVGPVLVVISAAGLLRKRNSERRCLGCLGRGPM